MAPSPIPHDPLARSADDCPACRAEFIDAHDVDTARVATRHVAAVDNCPGCVTARCTGDNGTGDDHTCGVW